jgi:hypothetical protein
LFGLTLRSVGENIHTSLDCLTATSFGASPAYCRRDYVDAQWNTALFMQADYTNNTVPARTRFTPDPVKHDRIQ